MEERVCHRCLTLRRRIDQLEADKHRLLDLLEAERRAGKRQAAPFSKGRRHCWQRGHNALDYLSGLLRRAIVPAILPA